MLGHWEFHVHTLAVLFQKLVPQLLGLDAERANSPDYDLVQQLEARQGSQSLDGKGMMKLAHKHVLLAEGGVSLSWFTNICHSRTRHGGRCCSNSWRNRVVVSFIDFSRWGSQSWGMGFGTSIGRR